MKKWNSLSQNDNSLYTWQFLLIRFWTRQKLLLKHKWYPVVSHRHCHTFTKWITIWITIQNLNYHSDFADNGATEAYPSTLRNLYLVSFPKWNSIKFVGSLGFHKISFPHIGILKHLMVNCVFRRSLISTILNSITFTE